MADMATINEFSDFEAFKKSRLFVMQVGTLVRKTRITTDLDAVRQIRRASISVLSNFAEGFERDGRAEFLQYLSYAKGSIGEIRAQLIYCLDQGYMNEAAYLSVEELGKEAGRLIGGLMRHINSSPGKGRKFAVYKPRTPETPSRRS